MKIEYKTLVAAMQAVALSKRAALNAEIGISLLHYTSEIGGTDATGKANLKAIYHAAGYECMAKEDRDYKTVNRRLNAMTKLYEKIGSRTVFDIIGDVAEGAEGTEAALNRIIEAMIPYKFYTLDNVLSYVGVGSNAERKEKEEKAAPVGTTEAGEGAAPKASDSLPEGYLDNAYANIVKHFGLEVVREFAAKLLVHVADQYKVIEAEEAAFKAHDEELAAAAEQAAAAEAAAAEQAANAAAWVAYQAAQAAAASVDTVVPMVAATAKGKRGKGADRKAA